MGAGRRGARRAVAVQGLVVALLAAAFLAQGVREALAVGVGGLALVLGHALSAVVAMGGIVPDPVAFGSLLLGAMGKWLVAIAVLAARAEEGRDGIEVVITLRYRWSPNHSKHI